MATDSPAMFPRLVVRSLANNARITAWTLVTLATCAALMTLFDTASMEVGRRLTNTLRQGGANAVASPVIQDKDTPREGDAAGWREFEAIVRRQGGSFVRLSVQVGLIEGTAVAIVAADPVGLQQMTPYRAVAGRPAKASGECFAGRRLADARRLQLGQTVTVDYLNAGPATRLRVVGIAETGDEDDDRLFVASPLAADGFQYALVSAPGGEPELARLQEALTAGQVGIELKPLRQIVHGEEQVIEKVNVLFVATLAAVLLLTALGVSASMLARVVERRKEYALLRAIGAKRRQVVAFLLAESASIGVVAALVGFGAGSALATLVVRRVFGVTIGPHAAALAMALVTTTLVALLAGAIAGHRLLRGSPATALRGE